MSGSVINKKQAKSRSFLVRTVFLLAAFGVAAFVVLAARLYQLQIVDNSKYESRALEHQLSQNMITASRGTIYDTNGKILAMSAEVENVFISPYEIDRDGHDAAFIAAWLSSILNVSREPIIEMSLRTYSQYEVVKHGVENDEARRVREFIAEHKLTGIHLEPATKRYYPNNSLASQVLGFTGFDNDGLDGMEKRYDAYLTGVDGRTVRLINARGTDLLFADYGDHFDAQNGNNITLTIDSSLQYYAEKHLAQAIIDYDVQNGASCIIMNAKTGAILALANYPNFDPNDFLSLGSREIERLDAISDETEYAKAFYDAQLRQWRNRSLADTYEPGSVFKIMTLAMAIEENVTSPGEIYNCVGSMNVLGREEDDPLNCWQLWGHGEQTLVEAMQNSCNMVSAQLALDIKAQPFYKYVDAFGLFDRTGLDMDIEGSSIWWDESVFVNRFNHSQLTSASIGQTFKVTPIQMITAAAAAVNGGYLMQPYIVQQIADSEGGIIEVAEPTVLRQVISEDTSALVRAILEDVVNEGTGKNAQVRGYRVGGKTGTSEDVEKLSTQEDGENLPKDYIVSFMGFAPANDPEIIVLLLLDTPSHDTGIYISGGGMAAPVVGNMLADILPLSLGIRPQYTEEDLREINMDMPRVTGRSVAEARDFLIELGFECEVVGDGESVTNQLPAPNAYVSSGTKAILYADAEIPRDQVEMPQLSGMSYSAAKQALESRGLFIRAVGAPKSDSRAEVSVQSLPAGDLTAYGSVIEVTLINKDAVYRN